MALIKYGGGIVQMSGSVSGNTHARNRFGNYMRARTKPVNPKSPRQSAARIAIMFLAEQWREDPMDDTKRGAWETYANSVNWNNKLGESVKLTGFNMFIRGNAAVLAVNGTLVTDGPTDLGLPPGDPSFAVSNCSEATQRADLAFDDGFDWCDEDNAFLICQMGEPQNPTRNFFAGPWRNCFYIAGSSGVPPTTPMPGLPNIPFTIIEGQKIWFRASIFRMDGRLSTKFECDPVIAVA